MSKYTKKDIIRLVEEEDVEFHPPAVHGYVWNHEKMRRLYNQLEKALENECMFDGSSIGRICPH